MNKIRRLSNNADVRAVALLLLLWLLFFWRLFTPIEADQASLAKGDFSGQFVAFAAYQYERLTQGEIPLWNPYNNGGLPFIADTQAAVFYPPRWLTIGLSWLAGGWSYKALQLEMTLHVLLYTVLMYAFVRRLTLRDARSRLAALATALIIGYGGYTTSYPPLQLAILEAAVWLPLVALGILEATRGSKLSYRYIALAGCGLGISWLAGHPQTSWFLTYVAAAYLAFRCYAGDAGWRQFLAGLVLLALISIGATAVTLFPGIEYLLATTREGLGFTAKGNGFPFRDIAQFVFPGSVSQWSPLFVGIPALFFIAVATIGRARESRFWLLVAVIGLLHSLGENSALYYASYNLIPGLRFFRGQERAAFLVANSLAILAGLGIVTAASWPNQARKERALRYWGLFTALLILVAMIALFAWTNDAERWGEFFNISARSAVTAAAAYLVIRRLLAGQQHIVMQGALIALVAFELFTVNMDHPANYDPVPHSEQLSMNAPPLVEMVLQDGNNGAPFRVDGYRGLRDNFGSLYGVMDMRGISPLFLKGPYTIIHRNYVDNPLAWELFAVKYVFSASDRLSVPSQLIGSGSDWEGAVYLHRLDNPRPFAQLMVDAAVVDSDEFALALMDDPRFDERVAIVLHQQPAIALPEQLGLSQVSVESFTPEAIDIGIETSNNAILSLSLPHYPGWEARLNGTHVEIIRAYAGLSAVEIPSGKHSLTLTFTPQSYAIGAFISLVTWLALAVLALASIRRR